MNGDVDNEKTVVIDATHPLDPSASHKADKTVQVKLPLSELRGMSGDGRTASSRRPSIRRSFNRGMFDALRDVGELIDSVNEKHLPGEIDRDVNTRCTFLYVDETYEVREKFAEGGQGVLSSGMDRNLRRPVAIKALRRELASNESQRAAFIAEAKVTAQLDHPSIVPIYSLNSDSSENLYLAMKLIKGQNLKTYIDQICTHYKLDGAECFDERKNLLFRLDVFLKICEALEYAHSRNVMHCDLKPENIMIGEYHEAYLMDWGIARAIKDPSYDPAKWTPPDKITGTPRFLSPEAVKGEHTDQRADIYAMGLILYETVTLQEAFEGSDITSVITNIGSGNMRPVTHRFGCHIDRDLRAIIEKASAYEPAERYSSVRALSDDIKRYMRGDEVSANPDSWFGASLRWMSRHRLTMLVIILGALLAAAGAVSFSLYSEMARERYLAARDGALTIVFNRCNRTAFIFDKQFTKFENSLKSLAAESLFMMNIDPAALDFTVPIYSDLESRADSLRPDSGYVQTGLYHLFVNYDRLEYVKQPSHTRDDIYDRTIRMSQLIPRFMRAVFESPYSANADRDSLETLRRRGIAEGVPVIRVLFGFKDGLYLCYPADSELQKNYDPRNREWYAKAVENGNTSLQWSNPYPDFYPETGLVITGVQPLIDSHGRFNGVAALDVSLGFLVRELKNIGNAGDFVIEKLFVGRNGEVILSTGSKFANDGAVVKTKHPPIDRRLYSRMVATKYGYIVDEEDDGREVVYVFGQISTVSWLYVEKLDMTRLMAANAGSGVLK